MHLTKGYIFSWKLFTPFFWKTVKPRLLEKPAKLIDILPVTFNKRVYRTTELLHKYANQNSIRNQMVANPLCAVDI